MQWFRRIKDRASKYANKSEWQEGYEFRGKITNGFIEEYPVFRIHSISSCEKIVKEINNA